MWGKVKDPVCGVKIEKTSPYRYKLDGKTFYFDSAACRQTFKDDPQRFVGDMKKKSLIQKLSEESDGKPKKCCH